MSDAGTAFEIIRSVTRTMLESRDVQPALDAVTRLISEKMGVEVCSIYLHDPVDDRLHLAAAHGLNRTALPEITLAPGEGLTGSVFATGDILNIADPRSDARFKYFPQLGEEVLNNFMGIPIPPGQARNRGVLVLQGREPLPFGPTLEDLAYTLAAQLGTLVESRAPAASGIRPAAAVSREAPPSCARNWRSAASPTAR
jgi:phosphotransferase system, enzyme I, PtsP